MLLLLAGVSGLAPPARTRAVGDGVAMGIRHAAPRAPRVAASKMALGAPSAAAADATSLSDQHWGLWFALPIFPFGTRKTVREEVVRGQVWTFDQLQGALYVHVPIRMTVVKLRDTPGTPGGGLFVYCPVRAGGCGWGLAPGEEAR